MFEVNWFKQSFYDTTQWKSSPFVLCLHIEVTELNYYNWDFFENILENTKFWKIPSLKLGSMKKRSIFSINESF